MSENNSNIESQEIDLSQISKKIGGFFEKITNSIFRLFLFMKRNIIIILALFVVGVVIGYFLDKDTKVYKNEIIVMPNFGSTDYLYSKIGLINSKLDENDTVFLKKIGIKNSKKFKKIAIEPVTDIYKFIDGKPQNFELIKLMAEDGDIDKIIIDPVTSKNYPYHKITYETSRKTSENETLEPLLNYLNTSDYFVQIQKQAVENVKNKIKENDSIINQINGFLNNFSKDIKNGKSDKLVFYNENTQLNDVIKTKELLVYEQGNRKIELINDEKIIKDISSVLNSRELPLIITRMKVLVPLFLIFLFIVFSYIKKKQKKH